MPTTYPTKYLRQYLADGDVWRFYPLRMHGGQTAVPGALWSHMSTAMGSACHGEAGKHEEKPTF